MTDASVSPNAPTESYEALYELAPCGFLLMTIGGTIRSVNRTLVGWSGYSEDQLVGATLGSLLDRGSQLFYETRYIPVLRLKGEVREVLLTLRRPDGSPLPILINSTVLGAGDDGVEVVHTAIFDSTQRRDYEIELLRSRQAAEASETRVRVLQDAATDFVGADSELTVAEVLVHSARLAFGATDTAVFMLDGAGTLRLVAGHSPIIDLVPLEAIRPGAEAIRTGQFIGLESLEQALAYSPPVADAMLATRLEAMTVIPLIADSGPIGTLACFYGRARRFDDDFSRLQTALALQASQVLARVALQRQLQHLAMHDQLTGLANRSMLQERMDEALAGADRSGKPFAVLFLDLDGFKEVNDSLGHAVGDSVLRQVGERLSSEIRLTDIVGRFGGDEFVVLCPETDEEGATLIAERIRVAVGAPLAGLLPRYPITASIGAAVYRSGGRQMTGDALFTEADEAMYRSKSDGKNRITVVTV